jgi:hypothetical protein
MGYQAALIVHYPQPVTIGGSMYRYFVLWADKSHIRTFAQTVRFISDPAEAVTPTIPPLAIPLPRPLYFLSTDPAPPGYPPGVWRLDPGGVQVERVTSTDLHITSFDLWLQDGRMAYGTSDGQLIVALPNQGARLLYDVGLQADDAVEIDGVAWSPDGTRLAYSVRYRELPTVANGESVGDADGLWLLSLDGAVPAKLLENRHLRQAGGELDVSELRTISDPVWSPDGSALMLTSSNWEWSDILWLDPVAPDPEERNLHDPQGSWTDGSWTDGGRSILLSGVDRACFGDLLRIGRSSGEAERLIEGAMEGLAVFKAQELPVGIVFLAFRDCDTQEPRLYLGRQRDGEFSYAPAGPSGNLCGSGYARDIVWDPTKRWAVVSCSHGSRLISLDPSLDRTIDFDLTPVLGPLADEDFVEVFWGASG